MTAPARILVAGIGNIFLGDDAFGVEVVRRLASCALPAGVRVVDFGIRGMDLAYALLEDYSAVILVDAAPRGRPPGTLYEIEPEPPAEGRAAVEPHAVVPHQILGLVRAMGGTLPPLRLVGCEPGALLDGEPRMGLSPEVAGAIEPAVALVQDVIGRLLERSHA
ncbi:MAG TPA: hydrogenase maturation protease [Myxococcaceae bacterium]